MRPARTRRVQGAGLRQRGEAGGRRRGGLGHVDGPGTPVPGRSRRHRPAARPRPPLPPRLTPGRPGRQGLRRRMVRSPTRPRPWRVAGGRPGWPAAGPRGRPRRAPCPAARRAGSGARRRPRARPASRPAGATAACSGVSRKSRGRTGAGSSGSAVEIARRSRWSSAHSVHEATRSAACVERGPCGVARGVGGDQLRVVGDVVGQVGHLTDHDGGRRAAVPAACSRRGLSRRGGTARRRTTSATPTSTSRPEARIHGVESLAGGASTCASTGAGATDGARLAASPPALRREARTRSSPRARAAARRPGGPPRTPAPMTRRRWLPRAPAAGTGWMATPSPSFCADRGRRSRGGGR